MLILTRRIHEKLVFGKKGEIQLSILDVKGKQVRIGISIPDDMPVDREEVFQLKQAQLQQMLAAQTEKTEI